MPYLESKKLKRLDKFSQFAVSAAKMAVSDAELNLDTVDRDRVGVCLGTALGGVGFAEEQSKIEPLPGMILPPAPTRPHPLPAFFSAKS